MEELAKETPAQYSLYYRGEKYWDKNKESKLLPGIYRNNNIQQEQAIFREATAHNPADFSEYQYTAEKLIKMQHYVGSPFCL
jgi:hypothetical protein